LTD
jgi:hypothetical protein